MSSLSASNIISLGVASLDELVVSLDERAKDEHKPFRERLLQEEARKLLVRDRDRKWVIEYIQFHKDRRDENGQRLV